MRQLATAHLQKPINFGWKDKIAPRIGVAWDVFRDGKLKIFGGYGVFYDQMKLNVAISSFGGQYWDNCVLCPHRFELPRRSIHSTTAPHRVDIAPLVTLRRVRYFAGGNAPSNTTFIENLNQRAFPTTCPTCSAVQEGVAPGLKPYEQHEALFGTDYQVSRTVALEVRYDRRRLDHVIEDAAVYNPAIGETFVIVNPGQGVNATVSGYCNFLYGYGAPGCDNQGGAFPANNNPAAARSYDGVELRATKALSNHWYGLFSYTYSHFRGNYTGLTSSDLLRRWKRRP